MHKEEKELSANQDAACVQLFESKGQSSRASLEGETVSGAVAVGTKLSRKETP